MTERSKRILHYSIMIAILVGVPLAAIEATLEFALDKPHVLTKGPPLARRMVQALYQHFDARMIQVLPECARYDTQLVYTLKPGHCIFRNREFSTDVYVNSLGLRDDEDSLKGPEIIVIGDSFAMGWGVEQEETFASLIEKESGLKVLNAGISSYETVRQILMLKRADTSKLKYLIVQYANNDNFPNRALLAAGLVSRKTEQDFRRAQDKHARTTRYVFGRHVYRLIKSLIWPRWYRNVFANMARAPYEPDDPDVFLEVMKHLALDLTKVRIIVTELSPLETLRSTFLDGLARTLAEGDEGEYWRRADMRVVDVSDVLDESTYFVLDHHLNALGHRAVAARIMQAMRLD